MKFVKFSAVTLISVLTFAPQAIALENFDWVMESISKQGSISNGDGHQWEFRKKGDGYIVEGAHSNTAKVTNSDGNLVRISGFPDNWNANGKYTFSKDGNKCRLSSKRSQHNMKWDC